jgi:hypothetical protein
MRRINQRLYSRLADLIVTEVEQGQLHQVRRRSQRLGARIANTVEGKIQFCKLCQGWGRRDGPRATIPDGVAAVPT